MRTILLLAVGVAVAVLSAGEPKTAAQDMATAPVYMRTRGGDDGAYGRGGYGYGRFPGYGYGYFQPYTPYVASSWYARPYPYHFDYFRGRWSGQTAGPAANCPCAEESATPSPEFPAPSN